MHCGPHTERKRCSTTEKDAPGSAALRFCRKGHHPKGGFMFGNMDASGRVLKRCGRCHGDQKSVKAQAPSITLPGAI